MSDVFLSGDLIFDSADAAQVFAERLSRYTFDAQSESDSSDPGYQVDGYSLEGRYVSLSLEVFDAFDLSEFAADAERAGASALLLTEFDESREDETTLCRKGGKKVRPSSVQKLVEKEAPGYRASDLIDDGKTTALEKMLDGGLNVEARAYKQTLLAMAVSRAYRYPEQVELLLQRGADPNALSDEYQWEPGDGPPEYVTPLYLICRFSYEPDEDGASVARALRALLAAGADPNEGGPGADSTPLQRAIYGSEATLVEMLLAAGADPQRPQGEPLTTPLSDAVGMYLDRQSRANDPKLAKYGAPYLEQARKVLCAIIKAGVDTTITDMQGNPIGDAFDVVPELASWASDLK